jgi:hypothetical protein
VVQGVQSVAQGVQSVVQGVQRVVQGGGSVVQGVQSVVLGLSDGCGFYPDAAVEEYPVYVVPGSPPRFRQLERRTPCR